MTHCRNKGSNGPGLVSFAAVIKCPGSDLRGEEFILAHGSGGTQSIIEVRHGSRQERHSGRSWLVTPHSHSEWKIK